jgi:hypothetical protein
MSPSSARPALSTQGSLGRLLIGALCAAVCAFPPCEANATQCGGAERWPVKMAADPKASKIDANHVIEISVADLNHLEPSDAIPGNDETTRMKIEKGVYRVHGFLALYKLERDGDYHLAITDKTARVTRQGESSRPTGHSFVAEIPQPSCYGGEHGQYHHRSRFASKINAARDAFEQGTANVNARRISPGSIPVTITGVLFFDFAHGQVGRGLVHRDANRRRLVVELHPILAIEFDRPRRTSRKAVGTLASDLPSAARRLAGKSLH